MNNPNTIDEASNAAEPITFSAYLARVRELLVAQPAGTGLKDREGGEFFLDGQGLYACLLDEPRAEGSVDPDVSAWDSARGCWDGSTPEATMVVIESPLFLSARDPQPKVLSIIRTASRDCRAQKNSLAANELLEAAGMAMTMLDALKEAKAFAERCDRLGLRDSRGQPVVFDHLSTLCRRAIAEATGAAS